MSDIQTLIDNLREWSDEYKGQPVFLTLMRAATELSDMRTLLEVRDRELAEAREQYRLSSVCREMKEQRDSLAEALRVLLSRVYYNSVYMDGILRNASFNDRPKAEFDRELAEARAALAAVEGGSHE